MRGTLPTVLCLALLAGGCGGGSDGPPVEQSGAAGGAAVAVRVRAQAWATKAEVAWLGRFAAWNAAFAEAGGAVGRFESGPRFDSALRGDVSSLAAYATVLAPIRRCAATYRARVGTAPTARLREAEERYRSSCASYRAGVELMLRAVREQDDGLAERAREEIEDAGKAASVAAGTLPPGEKQPLPRGRDGRLSRIDPRFGGAAARVAGKPVEARCWSAGDWRRLMVEERAYTRGKVNATVLGFASAGGERINLAPGICRGLARVASGRTLPDAAQPAFALALAVATLAHESTHAAGVADEAEAECSGIQWLARAARALGADDADAERLGRVYWARYDQLPAVYRSPECRDGGDLDLDLDSSGFP